MVIAKKFRIPLWLTLSIAAILSVCILVRTHFENTLAQEEISELERLAEIGNSLYNQSKYQEAITYYDKVLAIDPKHVDTLNNKGLALEDLGRPEEAITYYDKVLA